MVYISNSVYENNGKNPISTIEISCIVSAVVFVHAIAWKFNQNEVIVAAAAFHSALNIQNDAVFAIFRISIIEFGHVWCAASGHKTLNAHPLTRIRT